MSPDQSEPSRRSVLRGAAGVSAVGVAAAFAAGAGPALAVTGTRNSEIRKSDFGKSDLRNSRIGESGGAEAGEAETAEADGQLVAHLRDSETGTIDVYRGTSHVRIHDAELAARLNEVR